LQLIGFGDFNSKALATSRRSSIVEISQSRKNGSLTDFALRLTGTYAGRRHLARPTGDPHDRTAYPLIVLDHLSTELGGDKGAGEERAAILHSYPNQRFVAFVVKDFLEPDLQAVIAQALRMRGAQANSSRLRDRSRSLWRKA
jgi:hypothetical protein